MDSESLLYEIDNIDIEISRLRKNLKTLNERKKELTTQVIDNIQNSGQDTIIHGGKKYVLQKRQKHTRKPDKKKKEDTMLILQDEGFNGIEAEEMYNKITNALKGPEKTHLTLSK